MTVQIYRSSDPEAPTMHSGRGAANEVLYRCLVTGYGATRATAAVAFSTTPADGDTLTINSVTYRWKTTPVAANDIFIGGSFINSMANLVRIITGTGIEGTNYFTGSHYPHPDVTTLSNGNTSPIVLIARTGGTAGNSIAISKSSSVITLPGSTLSGGSGSNTKAGAGWTRSFTNGTSTDLAYTSTFSPGSGFTGNGYGCWDAAPGSLDGLRSAAIYGIEGITGLGTGTNIFPTLAQSTWSNFQGVFLRKSQTLDAAPRDWIVIADDRTCYIFVLTGDIASAFTCVAFGEFYSILPNTDLYRSMVIGRFNSPTGVTPIAVAAGNGEAMSSVNRANAMVTISGHYVNRPYTGTGGSTLFSKWTDAARSNGADFLGQNGLQFPNPVDGKVHISPIHVSDGDGFGVRGRLRGLYNLCHNANNFNASPASMMYDTIAGSGPYAGHTFIVLRNSIITTSGGCGYVLDITGPWETNT